MITDPDRTDPAEGHPEFSFKVYLRDHAKRTDDPEGDFVADARDEIARDHFATGNSWARILFYLSNNHACQAAIEAGRNVYFNRYLPWLRSKLPEQVG